MKPPFYRDTWRLRTLPQAGNGSGAVGLVREEPDPWAWLLCPFHAVTDNYAGPALLQYEWVSLLQGTDTLKQNHDSAEALSANLMELA